MKWDSGDVTFSATDLAKHLACRHLTTLDLAAARGELQPIIHRDPSLDALIERGYRHEAEYLNHLRSLGRAVLDAPAELRLGQSLERTVDAMRTGADVIPQADLLHGKWRGRADVLLRVDAPSKLGSWSYEVVDTKLARETRGGTILQLCLYSELVENIQGRTPDQMHVISPGRQFQPETFRPHDYLAYYRYVKSRLESVTTATPAIATYPEPVEQCFVCSWWTLCEGRRRQDDHLSFVAGISRLQTTELRKWEVTTLAQLGELPLPISQRPDRGSPESYAKAREQARLQLHRRRTGNPIHELLSLEPQRGLARLPEPSPGDIFLDFEADPFVDDGGLEYLLGYVSLDDRTEPQYSSRWSFERRTERETFEAFIDMVVARRQRFPDLHVYHFSQYETTALKRLMGRYATREDEIDGLLRAGVFVDLYGILKQALRASVERYSLKDLEIFFAFERQTDLRAAKKSRTKLECALELNEIGSLSDQDLKTVEDYNREDCVAALRLRDWLEGIRGSLVAGGEQIARPPIEPEEANEEVAAGRKRALELMERLLRDLPVDPAIHTETQHARWMLAHMLEWHRREEKAGWWEYFRLRALNDDQLLEERDGIAGLKFVKRLEKGKKTPTDRYEFPPQDTQIRPGDTVETSAGKFGAVADINSSERTIDIKKRHDTADLHPTSIFSHDLYHGKEQAESLYRIASWVADHGIDAPGPYRAGLDLLRGRKPRLRDVQDSPLYDPNGDVLEESRRVVLSLDRGVLPIQGPPGSGKTYTAARMICALLGENKKVGITAVSHRVIRKLLDEVIAAARETRLTVSCIEKVKDKPSKANPLVVETKDNARVIDALEAGDASLAAGTGWMWAREEFAESVDVLFVDEAGQMSLADVLAVSPAAKSLVLLGDPLQLDQPLQGSHPPGVEVSALQHLLGTHKTMPVDRGLFLSETWRLAPAICTFTSELFYEGRLKPHGGLERQALNWPHAGGAGLWFVPVVHEGNQNSSREEVDVVRRLVSELARPGVLWTNMKGEQRQITLDDILIVSPYNAQVFDLAERVPQARIGTVDKFQGQEAPVVIYSMATSSPDDAPRGMEFLYSLNRFNVATSRARCAVFVVASPLLLEPECQTPRQMKLANVLCRYREMAGIHSVSEV